MQLYVLVNCKWSERGLKGSKDRINGPISNGWKNDICAIIDNIYKYLCSVQEFRRAAYKWPADSPFAIRASTAGWPIQMGQRAAAACKLAREQESKRNTEDWLCRLWIMRPFAKQHFNCTLLLCLLPLVPCATCATVNELCPRSERIIRLQTKQREWESERKRARQQANCECHLLIAHSAELLAYELWIGFEVKPKIQLHHNITHTPITPR